MDLSGRFNLFYAAGFGVRFLWKLVIASFHVLWLATVQGPRIKNAVVAVKLRSHSDLLVTATGHALSLIPGSLVVEVDRSTSTLYLHCLGVDSQEAAEKVRDDVRATESWLIRMMGTKEDLALVRAEQKDLQGTARRGGQPMTVVIIIVSVMLAVAAAGAIFRIVRGPSILDRVLAADVLLAIVGGALVVDMVVNRNLELTWPC